MARKNHRCDLCGERIQVGTHHDIRSGVSYGDFYTMRMHPECHRYEQHGRVRDWKGDLVRTVNSDWYEDIHDPAFNRSDVHAYELAQLNPQ